jgi:hypothetical protein
MLMMIMMMMRHNVRHGAQQNPLGATSLVADHDQVRLVPIDRTGDGDLGRRFWASKKFSKEF